MGRQTQYPIEVARYAGPMSHAWVLKSSLDRVIKPAKETQRPATQVKRGPFQSNTMPNICKEWFVESVLGSRRGKCEDENPYQLSHGYAHKACVKAEGEQE